MMNEILFEASKIISYVTWVCTMVSFGLSLNGIFNKKSKMTKKVIVIWTTIGSFTFIAGLIIFLYGSSLIKV